MRTKPTRLSNARNEVIRALYGACYGPLLLGVRKFLIKRTPYLANDQIDPTGHANHLEFAGAPESVQFGTL